MLLGGLPAVALEGPKDIGKTSTAARRARTVFRLDLGAHRALLDAAPEQLMTAPGPVLIDEWQRWPQSWNLVRRAVDDGAPPGRFLLTGSATPIEAPVHSGAGRIVTLRMRPLSIAERDLEEQGLRVRRPEALRGEGRVVALEVKIAPAALLGA